MHVVMGKLLLILLVPFIKSFNKCFKRKTILACSKHFPEYQVRQSITQSQLLSQKITAHHFASCTKLPQDPQPSKSQKAKRLSFQGNIEGNILIGTKHTPKSLGTLLPSRRLRGTCFVPRAGHGARLARLHGDGVVRVLGRQGRAGGCSAGGCATKGWSGGPA